MSVDRVGKVLGALGALTDWLKVQQARQHLPEPQPDAVDAVLDLAETAANDRLDTVFLDLDADDFALLVRRLQDGPVVTLNLDRELSL